MKTRLGLEELIIHDRINSIESEQVEKFLSDRVHNLQDAGDHLEGYCPLHPADSGDAPNLSYYFDTSLMICTGCNFAGDLTGYTALLKNETPARSQELLANAFKLPNIRNQETASVYIKRELLEAALELFRKQVTMDKPSTYLKGRSYTPELIDFFELGYARENWDDLIRFLKSYDSNGIRFSDQDIINSDMTIVKSDSSHKKPEDLAIRDIYDRFREGIIFPLRGLYGELVGLSMRNISQETNPVYNRPKYMNSPGEDLFDISTLYDKSNYLYGIFQARQSIERTRMAFVAEGYTDMNHVYNKGIQNIVATCGSAFSEGHARLLKKVGAMDVAFIIDMDINAVGIKSALKACRVTIRHGLNPRIMTLKPEFIPEGGEPDPFDIAVTSIDAEDFLRKYFIEGAVDYLIRNTSVPKVEDVDGRIKYARVIMQALDTDNAAQKVMHITELCDKLSISYMQFMHEGHLSEWQKSWKNDKAISGITRFTQLDSKQLYRHARDYLIKLIDSTPDVAIPFITQIPPESKIFGLNPDSHLRKLYEVIIREYTRHDIHPVLRNKMRRSDQLSMFDDGWDEAAFEHIRDEYKKLTGETLPIMLEDVSPQMLPKNLDRAAKPLIQIEKSVKAYKIGLALADAMRGDEAGIIPRLEAELDQLLYS